MTLADTSKLGYVAIREPLGMRVCYANDDLVPNLLRFVVEERLVLSVTGPPLSRYTIRYPSMSITRHMVPSVMTSGAMLPRPRTAAV